MLVCRGQAGCLSVSFIIATNSSSLEQCLSASSFSSCSAASAVHWKLSSKHLQLHHLPGPSVTEVEKLCLWTLVPLGVSSEWVDRGTCLYSSSSSWASIHSFIALGKNIILKRGLTVVARAAVSKKGKVRQRLSNYDRSGSGLIQVIWFPGSRWSGSGRI